MRTLRSALPMTAALTVVAVAATTATATAGVLVRNAQSCSSEVLSQPFRPWKDLAQYTLAPGGAAESRSGWMKLDNGATIAPGNEPFYVHSAGDRRHLALSAGSSATTNSICVGIDHPSLRFFARSWAVSPTSSLLVEVLFETSSGKVTSAPIGSVAATSTWAPPPGPFIIGANLLPLLPGNNTAVAFRLTPVGATGWDVDDVYVDPFGRT